MIEMFVARTGWRLGVCRVFVDKFTDHSVWIEGRRSARESTGFSKMRVCETFEEAKDFALTVCMNELEKCTEQAKKARESFESCAAISIENIETVSSI